MTLALNQDFYTHHHTPDQVRPHAEVTFLVREPDLSFLLIKIALFLLEGQLAGLNPIRSPRIDKTTHFIAGSACSTQTVYRKSAKLYLRTQMEMKKLPLTPPPMWNHTEQYVASSMSFALKLI